VVKPGSPEDVSTVLQIIAEHQAPFAVMSGGQNSNHGFSSTTGVHISLKRLDQVILSPDNKTAGIGFGLVSAQSATPTERLPLCTG